MISKADYFETISQHKMLCTDFGALLQTLYADSISAHICAPVNTVQGRTEFADKFFAPLCAAFPDLERRTDILLEGEFTNRDGEEGRWFASTGYLVGSFQHDVWGVAATHKPVWLRYGWFDRIEGDSIVETIIIIDMARFLMDAGQWPLTAPLGAPLGQGQWPAPHTQDGVILTVADQNASEKSLKLVEAMIGGLMQFDGKNLPTMGMVRFWHPQFHWYGPGAIGSARGHDDYERVHQRPFLTAFPDRVGGNHKCRIGDGTYVASTGWPSIHATHSGDGWIGMPATGKRVTMRVIDFWRRDGDLLSENWVFIDMLDLFSQIGVDVMARVAQNRGTIS